MAIVTGRVSVRSKGFLKDIGPVFSTDFNLVLKSGIKYRMAIDQSTTCTGIAIQDVNKDITILFDFKRDSTDKEGFYRDLKFFIKKIIHGVDLQYFVYEKPIYTPNQRYTSRMLIELSGRVMEWKDEFEELQGDTVVDCVFPQTWQSLVVDHSKGKNRMRKKECIADDLCDLFPEFRGYLDMHYSKDLDAFDALGILTGYEKYAYTEDGVPQICGTIEKRHTSLVCYTYVDARAATSLDNLTYYMGDAVKIFKPKFKMFNLKKNKTENIRMASSNDPCIVTLLPHKYLNELRWKFDIQEKEGYVLVAFILNTSKFPSSSLNALKGVLPWNECVQSI